jgi:hypothetical protein
MKVRKYFGEFSLAELGKFEFIMPIKNMHFLNFQHQVPRPQFRIVQENGSYVPQRGHDLLDKNPVIDSTFRVAKIKQVHFAQSNYKSVTAGI